MKYEILDVLNIIENICLDESLSKEDVTSEIIEYSQTLSDIIKRNRVTFIPEYESWVWVIDPQDSRMIFNMEWQNKDWQINTLLNGAVFRTEEAAIKARTRTLKALWDRVD